MTDNPSTLITRRNMLKTSAAGLALGGAALAAGSAQARIFASTGPALNSAVSSSLSACGHTHAFQVSSLMTSLGSPVLTSAEKSDILSASACPSCGHSFTADLMAEMTCQNVSLHCDTPVAA